MKSTGFRIGLIVVLLVASASVSMAQRGRPGDDGAIQVRFGQLFPDGDSELWQLKEEFFTLDVSDFEGGLLGLTYVSSYNNRFEVGFNVDFYSEDFLSSDREFVDEFFNPIFHRTRLEMVPLTVDVRLLPNGRYRQRSGGRHVLKPAFYVGFGAGVNLWEFEEEGDFVFTVEESPGVFTDQILFDRFKDSGAALETHVLAGVEIPMGDSFNLLVEGRYLWTDDEVDESYLGPAKLDMGGPAFFIGGSFRF